MFVDVMASRGRTKTPWFRASVMGMAACALLGCCPTKWQVLGPADSSITPAPSSDAPTCKGPFALVHPARGKAAEFSIASTGDVTRSDGNADDGTVSFFDGPADIGLSPSATKQLFLRLYAASSVHPGAGQSILVWEGFMLAGEQLDLPKCDWGRPEDTWRLEVFTLGYAYEAPSNLTRAVQERNNSASPSPANTAKKASATVPGDPESAARSAAVRAKAAALQAAADDQAVQADVAKSGLAQAWTDAQRQLESAQAAANEAQKNAAPCAGPPGAGGSGPNCPQLLAASQAAFVARANAAVATNSACTALHLSKTCDYASVADFEHDAAQDAKAKAADAATSATAARDAAGDARRAATAAMAMVTATAAPAPSAADLAAASRSGALANNADTSATAADASSKTAAAELSGLFEFYPNCYSPFGTFELPIDDFAHTVMLPFGTPSASASASTPATTTTGASRLS